MCIHVIYVNVQAHWIMHFLLFNSMESYPKLVFYCLVFLI